MKYLFIFIAAVICFSCTKDENTIKQNSFNGKIIGYLKCDETNSANKLFGIFAINSAQDSLLSFNIPPLKFNLDTSNLENGIYYINGDSVSFTYTLSDSNELKISECPPTNMLNPTFFPIENFSQIIISDLKLYEK